MWKGFLHTPRYSYYDSIALMLSAIAYTDKAYALWVGIIVVWFVSALFIERRYKKKG